ncbi:MAG: hypothetical protein IPK80_29165 [Nannocystis sp.]|nr:hypothetical protein [Nannocystis sp.]
MSRLHIMIVGLTVVLGSLGCAGDDGASGAAPEFSAQDRNPESPSYGQDVSPRDHVGHVSGWFFLHSTCGYCRGQVPHLDALQDELDASHPELGIRLLLVNELGYEAEEAAVLALTDLPYLQDNDPSHGAWAAWRPVFRDVVILDAENVQVGRFNLTEYDVGDPGYYAALRGMLLAAAGAE